LPGTVVPKEGLEAARESAIGAEKGAIVQGGEGTIEADRFAICAICRSRTKTLDEKMEVRLAEQVNVRDLHPPEELVRACALLGFLDRSRREHVEAVFRWLDVCPRTCAERGSFEQQ
jgi:hypothetical protein